MNDGEATLSSDQEVWGVRAGHSVRWTVSSTACVCLIGTASYGAALQIISWWSVAAVVLYTAFGLGCMRRAAICDRQAAQPPRFAFVQGLFNLGLIEFVLLHVEGSQSICYVVMCLAVMWDMPSFSEAQGRGVALWAAFLLAIGPICMRTFVEAVPFDVSRAVIDLLGAATVLAILRVGAYARALRKWQVDIHLRLDCELRHLQRLENHEELTGLINRRHMQRLLEAEVHRCQRSGGSFALALLDLDHFKSINDAHGHQVGDDVLKAFADILREVTQEGSAFAARWGGEEFLLLWRGATIEDLMPSLAKLQTLTRQTQWADLSPGLSVSCSGGFGVYRANESLAELIQKVDEALYRAKRGGRDTLTPSSDLARDPVALQLAEQSRLAGGRRRVVACQSAEMSGGSIGAANEALEFGRSSHHLQLARMVLFFNMLWLCVIWSVGVPLKMIDPSMAIPISLAAAMGGVFPYLLAISGRVSHGKDPLMLPQFAWALSLLAIGYFAAPLAKPIVLQWMCHVLALASISASARKNKWVGAIAVIVTGSMLAYLLITSPIGGDIRKDVLTLLVAGGVLLMVNHRAISLAQLREAIESESAELADTSKKIIKLVSYDSLTGLANRRHVQDLLQTEAVRQDQQGRAFCVALVDLDHFKSVNDQYGHLVGDEVLRSFAQVATLELRKIDVVARWGGEEFLVVMKEVSEVNEAAMVLDRLRLQLQKQMVSASHPELRVTMSAGLAIRKPGESLQSVLLRADAALYSAKRSGRDRIALPNSDVSACEATQALAPS